MDDFFDYGGAGTEIVAGPLIGGGLAQLGILATRKWMPGQAKWAGTIGAALGTAAGAFLMSKPQHKEKGLAAVAVALLVGVPRQIEDLMMPSKLSGVEQIDILGAYDAELAAYNAELADGYEMEGGTPIEVLNSGSGGTGLIGNIVPENMAGDMGADVEIEDAGAFGATGF
jgi:hypothetical protein